MSAIPNNPLSSSYGCRQLFKGKHKYQETSVLSVEGLEKWGGEEGKLSTFLRNGYLNSSLVRNAGKRQFELRFIVMKIVLW
jgi:hypothetical protein